MNSSSRESSQSITAATPAALPRKPRLLDLFSGIGGFSLGLERAGFETVAFCEVNPKCRHLLAHHWPNVSCYDDVTTLTAERLAADGIGVDAICGGFPCQDLSYAGAGAGLDGARSGLFFEIVRLAREIQRLTGRLPLLILENVSALLGRGIGDVLGALAALGYDAWWDCIPASAVGAPHRRDRIWIVAYPRGEQHEGYGDALRRAVSEELSRATLADAHGRAVGGAPAGGEGSDTSEGEAPHRQRLRVEPGAGCSALADAALRERDDEPIAGPRQDKGFLPAGGCSGDDWGVWATEPDVGRVAHGVPARVDRLHGLGNAVVPQIPEILGRAALVALAQQEAA